MTAQETATLFTAHTRHDIASARRAALPGSPRRGDHMCVFPRNGGRKALPSGKPGWPTLYRLVFVASLFGSTPSFAQDYATRDVGDWTVASSQDRKGCFLTRTYQKSGGTTLLLGLDVDGSNRVSVLNAHWSIKAKDRQSLNFRLSNASFPKHLAIGIASDGKKGFVTSFGEKFPAHFAASRFLHISRGDVPVEQLALDGSGAAVVELRKCVDIYRRKPATSAETKDREPSSPIPLDPFAPDAGRRSKK